MTDEHMTRQWNRSHTQFSADIDRSLLRLGRFIGNRLHANSAAYAPTACNVGPAKPGSSATASAALAGALACLATTLLLLTVAVFTTAGTHGTAALALVSPAIVA